MPEKIDHKNFDPCHKFYDRIQPFSFMLFATLSLSLLDHNFYEELP